MREKKNDQLPAGTLGRLLLQLPIPGEGKSALPGAA